jgi:hypothetical protein
VPAWTGQILITRTADGTYWIGHSAPNEVPLDYGVTQVFESEGNFDPVEGPSLVRRYDDGWLAEYQRIGFTFKLTNTQQHPPHNNLAASIVPNQTYAAEEIAKLFGTATERVKQFWDNMDPPKEPRLRFRSETGRGAARVSSGYDLLEFLHRFEKQI